MSTLPAYSKVLRVRPEVLSSKDLLDMVNLADAGVGASPESPKSKRGLAQRTPVSEAVADAKSFFELTYPTEDVKQTLYALQSRLRDPQAVSGTILLAGRYGLGKSHVLLAAHHALSKPRVARAWAERWNIEPLELSANVRVVTRNFIQRTAENLWEVLFDALGRPELSSQISTYPDGEQITAVLDARPTILILDELERWYDALPAERQSRNRNFIQALTEVAQRDARITLVTSVLGEHMEPAETLRRVRPLELAFRSPTDRQEVLLYRLFTNRGNADRTVIERVVDRYIDTYRNAGIDGLDTYRQRMLDTYPFTPELLDIITKKIPNLGGFQNTRGSLRFLSKIVQVTHAHRPMVSSQDLPFWDRDLGRDLHNLDNASGGEVVRRALGDNLEAVPDTLPHKAELFSAIVFYSIADPAQPGATERDILLAVLDPEENPNHIKDSIRQLRRVAFNLHEQNERLVFLARENPHARIHAVAQSPQVTDDACRAIIGSVLLDAWGASDRTVVHTGTSQHEDTTRRLGTMSSRRPLYLVSTRTLTPALRLQLQNLHPQRNLVLLIEPRFRTERRGSDHYDLTADPELLDHARQIEACNRLLESKPDRSSETVYRDVLGHEKRALADTIAHRYGHYVSWHQAGSSDAAVDDGWYELGHFDTFSAAHFLDHVKKEYSGLPYILDRTRKLWTEYRHRRARDIIEHFERTPGEPVPYDETLVPQALRTLAQEGALALQDERGNTYCRALVRELSMELLPACIVVPAPPKEDSQEQTGPLPVHGFVSAEYDRERKAVLIRWDYPAQEPGASRHETLVQRYPYAKGWEEGKEQKLDLDMTHENNRYLGPAEHMVDTEHLAPGSRYFYYVFLIDRRAGNPRIVLSRRCDVHIPEEEAPERANEIRIALQPRQHDLLTEIEKRVMSSRYMSSDSRVRKLEIELRGVHTLAGLDEMAGTLSLVNARVEAEADLRFTLRGSFDRQQILKLARSLPKLEAQYAARLYLDDEPADE